MDRRTKAQAQPRSSGWKNSSTALGLTLLFAVCIFCAWVLIEKVAFDRYSTWDDEGYFVLIVRQFLKNGGLYVKTFSQYGPFYTLAESSLHRLFGLPVDLDGGRILTVGYILGSATLLSVFVGRLTRELTLGLACFTLTVISAAPMLEEPGHPHGIIVSLIAVALCLSLLVGTRHETAALVLLGAVGAALALTKINNGLFFCFALALPLTAVMAKAVFRPLLLGLLVILSLAMPPALMSAHLKGWAGSFCLYMLISFAALFIAAFQSMVRSAFRPIEIAYPITGFVMTAVLILAYALLTGSTPASLVSGIVTRTLGQPNLFYAPFEISAGKLSLLLLPVVAIAAASLARRKGAEFDVALAVVKVAVALIAAAAFLWDPDRAMFYSLPLLPLLLLSAGSASTGAAGMFSRLFLVSLIDFEMLQAYPVINTHHIALTPAGAWICLMLYDGWSGLAVLPTLRLRWPYTGGRAALEWLCLVLAVPVFSFYLYSAPTELGGRVLHHREIVMRWLKGQPIPQRSPRLDLPGARLLHMPAAEGSIYRRVAEEVHANCDTLFTMPGMGSLNVWSETPPPNGFNLTAWMEGFTAPEQEAIRTKLEQADRPCVVYNPELVKFWLPPGLHLDAKAPMVEYVLQDTKTVFAAGDYEIRVPYNRGAPFTK
ncbi:MAG TPA: hypothetical protein VHZ07_18715 [Bryobacteraceae bacterium]|jgi:hypothetical protein|nr:hypothetical protein [Bryobacteraceae bacterium]